MNRLNYTQKTESIQTKKIWSNVGDRLTFALKFFDRGVGIVPCYPKSKAFLRGYGPNLRRIVTDDELHKYLFERKNNYALLTGTGGGDYRLVVIDFDDLSVYRRFMAAVGENLSTFQVATSRGAHVYFWSKDARSWRGDGFEVKGTGLAVMGAFSVHPDNVIYAPLTRPQVLHVETLSTFPLLSESIPVAPQPAVIGAKTSGGLLDAIKNGYRIYDLIVSNPDLNNRIQLVSSGPGWYMGFCPFHKDEKKRSFWLDANRDLYGCFACGDNAAEDVINFYARLHNLSNSEAIERMRGSL